MKCSAKAGACSASRAIGTKLVAPTSPETFVPCNCARTTLILDTSASFEPYELTADEPQVGTVELTVDESNVVPARLGELHTGKLAVAHLDACQCGPDQVGARKIAPVDHDVDEAGAGPRRADQRRPLDATLCQQQRLVEVGSQVAGQQRVVPFAVGE